MTIDGIEYLTAAEAATHLNTTPLRVLMLVKEQQLMGRQVGDAWYISRPSLDCVAVHGIGRPAAKGCHSQCSSAGCGCR